MSNPSFLKYFNLSKRSATINFDSINIIVCVNDSGDVLIKTSRKGCAAENEPPIVEKQTAYTKKGFKAILDLHKSLTDQEDYDAERSS